MTRTQRWLAIALGVQLLLIFWLRSPLRTLPANTAQRALLPGIEQLEPDRIELIGEEGDSLTLVRQKENWTLDQPSGFPVDEAKVEGLMESLKSLQTRQPVVSSRRYHEAFRVDTDQPVGRIKIFASDDEEPAVDLLLGTSTNYRVTHMREQRQDEVFEVAGFAAHEARPDPTIWMEKTLLQLDPRSVTELRMNWRGERFQVSREGDAWLAGDDGAATDPVKVLELLRAASSVRMTEAIGVQDPAAHGLDRPEIEWSLTTQDGETHEIWIGAPIEGNEDKRYVSRSDFRFTGAIWMTDLEALNPNAFRDVRIAEDTQDSAAAADESGG